LPDGEKEIALDNVKWWLGMAKSFTVERRVPRRRRKRDDADAAQSSGVTTVSEDGR
jgi:hypothetical protein